MDLEQQIIGTFIVDEGSTIYIDRLNENDFSSNINKMIFKAIQDVLRQDKPIDMLTIYESNKSIDISYLTTLTANIISTKNIESHIKQLKNRNNKKKLKQLGEYIVSNHDKEGLLKQVEDKIYNMSQSNDVVVCDSKELVINTVEEIERRYNSKELEGFSTGFKKYDRALNGMRKGLHILGARPGMGKTAFAIQIGKYAACYLNKKVGIFNLEMTKEKLMERIIFNESNTDRNKIIDKTMEEEDWNKINKASNFIYSRNNLYLCDNCFELSDIKTEALRIKKQHGLDLLIIDYIQLISVMGLKGMEKIDHITDYLIRLWKQLDCPIIAISSINRGCEQRTDKRPMLSDLRESGKIEFAADSVTFLYRDEYYNPDTEKKNIAEIIIAKNREGSTGLFEVAFVNECMKFIDM